MAKKRRGRMTKEERRELMELARIYFLKEEITQKEIAERIGVGEKTIGRWIEEEGWRKLKRNILLTREEQLSNLYAELEEINEEIKNRAPGKRYADKILANTRRYLIKDIADLERETSTSEFINAFTPFINDVKKENLDDARTIAGYADVYIKTKLR